MNNRATELFTCGQIRLAELSVCNWGSFHGLHTARIDPEGTLITGDNGAGKSTLIDGLMALLLSSKASFNMAAAQGDRSDRSLVSYIRGSHGSSHDGAQTKTNYKREGAVATGLRALYQADDGSVITLAAMFWNTKPSNVAADFKRIYLVAKRNLSLEELLKVFGEGEARQLKKALRDDPLIAPFDAFTDYQAYYRDCLHMDNRNAPNLLSRALGLKKIDDLTILIRDLVLEPNNIREDARNTVREFDDLVATHHQLLDARRQQEKLGGLPEIGKTLDECQRQIESLSAERDGLAIYFGEICADLWRQRMAQIEDELVAVRQKLVELRRQEEDATGQVEQRHADYVQAGGDRVETAKDKLAQTKRRLGEVSATAGQYQKEAAEVSLDDALSETVFNANKQRIAAALANIGEENEKAQDGFADAASKLATEQDKLRRLQEEIREIESNPDSSIDRPFLALRSEIIKYLELDKNQLMFIGELVDVQPEHFAWKGAIARALGGLRTTLAVPQAHYPLVTRWLNGRHTGLHVRVQVVKEVSGRAQFFDDGYLRKLAWRDHTYREWLKHHLARFDLHCVETTDTLDATPFSMTKKGLIQMERGRFEKKDQTKIDDQRRWQLGFSNKDKLAVLRQDERHIQQYIEMCNKGVRLARLDLNAAQARVRLWETLETYQWDDIDVPRWQYQAEQAQAVLDNLTRSGSDLKKAQQAWDKAKERLKEIQADKDVTQKAEGTIENRLAEAQLQREKANRAAAPGLTEGVREALQKRVAERDTVDIDRMTSIEGQHRRDVESELGRANSKYQTAQNRATGIMSSFRTGWEVIAAEWGADMRSLPQYLEHLLQLEQEGLPALVEQFQARLTKCALQSLAGIRSSMDSEREEINDRIETINRVLKRTEFRQGSHLKLRTKKDGYPHVDEFNRQLTRVLGNHSEDDEARFQQLKSVIEILDKASNPTTANTLESQRLLDPRFQLSFFAEELDSQNGDVRDVLHSSSGKSGGEKESFAGTIVAASLAYVLTPDGCDRPIYSTVFLDEAFSNTAEAVSRRVLRVFQELKIHVNLITPYKNLNLARESARSLLIAERNSSSHESHLCEVTWEEVDRRLAQHRQNKVKDEAQAMGVELDGA
ncbi:MAG: AAA family ATPase [Ectothiorhodospiraceae bacterium]|nr:AAA family ATPase [Ectothiorhodospiraceae bacterium]